MDKLETVGQMSFDLMRAVERDEDGNPLTLDGAIRSAILKSPDCIRYRDDALGLMYCVLGAGIGWKNGRLADVVTNNYMNLPPSAPQFEAHPFGMMSALERMVGARLVEDIDKELAEARREEQRKIIDTVLDIERRVQEYRPEGTSWYPISWYQCNLCAPFDAQQDFFEGAVETAQLIIDARLTPGTQRWIVHQRTRKCAQEILQVLLQRVGE